MSRFFGRSDGGLTMTSRPGVRAAGIQLAKAALDHVKDSRGVRVEDYLTVLAATTGEAALVSALGFDIERSTFTPGAAVFGDEINRVLSGDATDAGAVPPDSVVGILIHELVGDVVPISSFNSLDSLYAHVAASVGKAGWGEITTTVGPEHQPSVLPLRAAFELRGAVDKAQSQARLPLNLRYVPCALALAEGVRQVQAAMDVRISVQLALEVVFAMAKMAPMSTVAFEAVAKGAPTHQP